MVEGAGGVVGTDTSCPRCGAAADRGGSSCRDCGFVFFESPTRRSRPRATGRAIAVALLVLAAGAAAAVLVLRDPAPGPPEAVPAAGAERRLEQTLRAGGVDDARSVRCRGAVRPDRLTRCRLLYLDGDTQLLLVDLAANGKLDIQQPYPAQRRPGRRPSLSAR
jgi:hypothetical protein